MVGLLIVAKLCKGMQEQTFFIYATNRYHDLWFCVNIKILAGWLSNYVKTD